MEEGKQKIDEINTGNNDFFFNFWISEKVLVALVTTCKLLRLTVFGKESFHYMLRDTKQYIYIYMCVYFNNINYDFNAWFSFYVSNFQNVFINQYEFTNCWGGVIYIDAETIDLQAFFKIIIIFNSLVRNIT